MGAEKDLISSYTPLLFATQIKLVIVTDVKRYCKISVSISTNELIATLTFYQLFHYNELYDREVLLWNDLSKN